MVHESGEQYGDRRLHDIFQNRMEVQKEITRHFQFKRHTWEKINDYYYKRCDLVHRRADLDIRDRQIEDYRRIVQIIFSKLFGLKFKLE